MLKTLCHIGNAAQLQLKRGAFMLKYKSQRGFTIVELLIVIVVIGILAALVLNTFAGVQERARDTERQTDTRSVASQLERFYTDEGYYPAMADITAANLDGIDEGALVAPRDESGQPDSFVATATPAEAEYGYIGVGNAACVAGTAGGQCESFTLYYHSENAEDGSTEEYVAETSINN